MIHTFLTQFCTKTGWFPRLNFRTKISKKNQCVPSCPGKSQALLPPWKNRVDFTGYPSNHFSGCRLKGWLLPISHDTYTVLVSSYTYGGLRDASNISQLFGDSNRSRDLWVQLQPQFGFWGRPRLKLTINLTKGSTICCYIFFIFSLLVFQFYSGSKNCDTIDNSNFKASWKTSNLN